MYHDEDQELRNLAQSIRADDTQGAFNYWVRSLAYFYRTSTDEILKLAMVKQDGRTYTGESYDYREEIE